MCCVAWLKGKKHRTEDPLLLLVLYILYYFVNHVYTRDVKRMKSAWYDEWHLRVASIILRLIGMKQSICE